MKIVYLVCMSITLILFSVSGKSAETEITILAVSTGGADITDARTKMQYLKDTWDGYSGTSIKLINGGYPITLTTTTYTGSYNSQLSSAKNHPEWENYRNSWAADVVIIFTGRLSNAGACGAAVQYHWNDSITTAPNVFDDARDGTIDGLDTYGKDDSYYAIVATGSHNNCSTFDHIAAHEFGHLLGAGHTLFASDRGDYLFTDSHADYYEEFYSDPFVGSFTFGYYTIVAERDPSDCFEAPRNIPCFVNHEYSNISGDKNNERALNKTAKSVAL